MFKRTHYIFIVMLMAVTLLVSCGPKQGYTKFDGIYDDEFGNHFELYEDHNAIIQFVGQTERIETKWAEKKEGDKVFATIEYNGDPEYYFLYNGALYRHKENMDTGFAAIELK